MFTVGRPESKRFEIKIWRNPACSTDRLFVVPRASDIFVLNSVSVNPDVNNQERFVFDIQYTGLGEAGMVDMVFDLESFPCQSEVLTIPIELQEPVTIDPDFQLIEARFVSTPIDFRVTRGSEVVVIPIPDIKVSIRTLGCDQKLRFDDSGLLAHPNFRLSLGNNINIQNDVTTFFFPASFITASDIINPPSSINLRFFNDCGEIPVSIPVNVNIVEEASSVDDIDLSVVSEQQFLVYDNPILIDANPQGVRTSRIIINVDRSKLTNCQNAQLRFTRIVQNLTLSNYRILVNGQTTEQVIIPSDENLIDVEITYNIFNDQISNPDPNAIFNFDIEARCPGIDNWFNIRNMFDYPVLPAVPVKLMNTQDPLISGNPRLIPNSFLVDYDLELLGEPWVSPGLRELSVGIQLLGNYEGPIRYSSPDIGQFNCQLEGSGVLQPVSGQNILTVRYNGGLRRSRSGFFTLILDGGRIGGQRVRVVPIKINPNL